MRVFRLRWAAPAVALAILPFGLTACGLIGGGGGGGDGSGGGGAPVDDGADKSRVLVQAYLDAMKSKDVATGRTQLCVPMQETFDKSATGTNGDFAKHFTVPAATITDVRANDGTQEVSTSITVKATGVSAKPTNILFTVVKNDGQWCIAKEVPGTNATASTPASPSTDADSDTDEDSGEESDG